MKTQTTIFRQISQEGMNNLTGQVKETLAIGYNTTRQFSAADLWNIQRQRKALRSRRGFA